MKIIILNNTGLKIAEFFQVKLLEILFENALDLMAIAGEKDARKIILLLESN